MPAPHTQDFATYARTHWPRLIVTARLLGHDDGAARELVRRTLARLCARWRRVPRDDVDFHVRRALVRGHLRRLRGRRTARRRAVLVLRFREGLADQEIAQLLGCSAGAVRSLTRQGLRAAGADPARLREMYAAAAADVAPSEVPLAEVQAQGGVLRRRRVAVVAAAGATALLTVASLSFGGGGGQDEASGTGSSTATGSPVRVVTPGERVAAGPGVRVWLTADAGHWSVPVSVPGNDSSAPHDKPGVSLRADTVNGGFLLSGLFHGLHGEPSRVEIRTGDDGARATAKILVLAGSPGWGVWYARTPLPEGNMKALLSGGDRIVTVYDAEGNVAARSAHDWWRA